MSTLDQCEFMMIVWACAGGVVGIMVGAFITDEVHKSLYGRKGRWR